MLDVGVAQPEVCRLGRDCIRVRQALAERPDLARPSGRQRPRRNDAEALRLSRDLRRVGGSLGGAVRAVIVGDHDVEPARVVLREQ
jgi:hypothetical protein